jgi:LemA protein
MWDVIAIILFVIVAVVGGGIAIALQTHNRLMALDERCETAFSDVDVQLKHRHNILPGIVETVRGFAEHERGIITEIAKARASALRASGPEMRLEAETQLGQSINTMLTMVESYPEIKASADFRDLRHQLIDSDAKIAGARRFYNMACNELNATLRQFPGVLIARFAQVSSRKRYDIGIERVMMDEPMAFKL